MPTIEERLEHLNNIGKSVRLRVKGTKERNVTGEIVDEIGLMCGDYCHGTGRRQYAPPIWFLN